MHSLETVSFAAVKAINSCMLETLNYSLIINRFFGFSQNAYSSLVILDGCSKPYHILITLTLITALFDYPCLQL